MPTELPLAHDETPPGDGEMPSALLETTANVLLALADAQIFGVEDSIGLSNADVGLGFWLGESMLDGTASQQAVQYAAHLVGVKYRRQASERLGSEAIVQIARFANAGCRKAVSANRKPCVRVSRQEDGHFQATFTGSYFYELKGLKYTNVNAASGRLSSSINAVIFEQPNEASAFIYNVQAKRTASVRYDDAAAAYFAERPPAPKRVSLVVRESDDARLSLAFPYDDRFVAAVRTIPGRRFDSSTKAWTIPRSEANAAFGAFANYEQAIELDDLRPYLTASIDEIRAAAERPRPIGCVVEGKGRKARVRLGFEYDAGLVALVREQPGRSFDPDTKTWSIPADLLPGFLRQGEEWKCFQGYDLSALIGARERIEAEQNEENARIAAMLERDRLAAKQSPPPPPYALVGLRPYQCAGVAFLTASQAVLRDAVNATVKKICEQGVPAEYVTEAKPLGLLLRDDMGLGKTAQTIRATMVLLEKKRDHALIVCPASVKLNWEREIAKFGGENQRVQVLSGKVPLDDAARWWILNYDILDRYHDELLQKKVGVVVFDEAHKIKNPKAKRTKYAVGYQGRKGEESVAGVASVASERVILLTGTPIFNRPRDVRMLLHAIGHPVSNDKRAFEETFCEGHLIYTPNGEAWDASGASNLSFLREVVAPLSLGRMKSEVLTDLPPKEFQVLPIDVPLAEYRRVMDERARLRKEKQADGTWNNMSALAELTAERMATARAKAPLTAEYVADSASTQNKVILFSMSTEVLDLIESSLAGNVEGKIVRVDGSRSQKQRMAAVDAFQDDPETVVLLGQTQAAGEGVNLTAASTIVFNDIGYIPGEIRQAIDRAYRIGQTKNLFVVFMAAANTLDETQVASMMEKITVNQEFEGATQESEELLNTLRLALDAAEGKPTRAAKPPVPAWEC